MHDTNPGRGAHLEQEVRNGGREGLFGPGARPSTQPRSAEGLRAPPRIARGQIPLFDRADGVPRVAE